MDLLAYDHQQWLIVATLFFLSLWVLLNGWFLKGFYELYVFHPFLTVLNALALTGFWAAWRIHNRVNRLD